MWFISKKEKEFLFVHFFAFDKILSPLLSVSEWILLSEINTILFPSLKRDFFLNKQKKFFFDAKMCWIELPFFTKRISKRSFVLLKCAVLRYFHQFTVISHNTKWKNHFQRKQTNIFFFFFLYQMILEIFSLWQKQHKSESDFILNKERVGNVQIIDIWWINVLSFIPVTRKEQKGDKIASRKSLYKVNLLMLLRAYCFHQRIAFC